MPRPPNAHELRALVSRGSRSLQPGEVVQFGGALPVPAQQKEEQEEGRRPAQSVSHVSVYVSISICVATQCPGIVSPAPLPAIEPRTLQRFVVVRRKVNLSTTIPEN